MTDIRTIEQRQGQVRGAVPVDLRATADLHERLLPDGFFARLGSRFLEAYHATFLASPTGVALVVGDPGRPDAFLVGTLDNEAHYRWVARRRPVHLARAGLVAMARHHRLAREFAATRLGRYGRGVLRHFAGRRRVVVSGHRAEATAPDPAPGPVAVLTHVAVARHARRRGLGRGLLAAFVELAGSHGASEIRLISPVASSAPQFYRALGWRSLGRRRASDGTLVEEFQFTLS